MLMLCFVYVSQHNTKEWEREENILVLIKTCDTQNVFQPQGTVNYCCSEITDWKPLL